jgi:hypothetical protein
MGSSSRLQACFRRNLLAGFSAIAFLNGFSTSVGTMYLKYVLSDIQSNH